MARLPLGWNKRKKEARRGKMLKSKIPLGEQFIYELDYSENQLKVTVNDETVRLNTDKLKGLASYFKAGNYNQGNSRSEIHLFSLHVHHSD
jgi:hypothetical protein